MAKPLGKDEGSSNIMNNNPEMKEVHPSLSPFHLGLSTDQGSGDRVDASCFPPFDWGQSRLPRQNVIVSLVERGPMVSITSLCLSLMKTAVGNGSNTNLSHLFNKAGPTGPCLASLPA